MRDAIAVTLASSLVLAVAGVASAVRPVQDYLERTHVELSAEPSVRLART